MVAQTRVGTKAKVTIIRKGKKKTLTIKIAKLQEEAVMAAQNAPDAGRELGLSAQELTPELAKSMGLDDDHGVIVADVEPGSPAAATGIRRGDLILEINRQTVKQMQDYLAALEKRQKDDSILLWIKRGDHKRFVVISTK